MGPQAIPSIPIPFSRLPLGWRFAAYRTGFTKGIFRWQGRDYRRRVSAAVRCGANTGCEIRTCKICKGQYDPLLNHPRACRYHTAHFGGETKRKFESVYTGGTMNTPDAGQVFQYWHCCGSEDPFDVGCTAGPHCSYD